MDKSLLPVYGPLPAPGAGMLRRWAAITLRAASRTLALQARRLQPRPRVSPAPQLEFYCEAGAPEGALYLDGELVGRVPGVTRL